MSNRLANTFPEPWRRLEINGGQVEKRAAGWRFLLPGLRDGYADAQIDDYGLQAGGRKDYLWNRGVRLTLRARFSHRERLLLGTAGFGFWNAPFGDPTIPWPALPQATWFFYASAPTDLPLAPRGPGRGWFAATLDATTSRALVLAPLAPLILLLIQRPAWRRRIWPLVRARLGITFAPLPVAMTEWHHYELEWRENACVFRVDNRIILKSNCSPRGPLGFVCWLDNQYMVARENGRFRWGSLSIPDTQWLEVADLALLPL